MKYSEGLFQANVKTFTCTTWNFTENGYDITGSSTDLAKNILLLKILEGYTYQLIFCEFTSNKASLSTMTVADNVNISAISPGKLNLLIQDTNFVNNQGGDSSGSFLIGNNAWLNM